MYIVTIKNGDVETTIHGEHEKLQSGKIVKGLNAIDSFTFSILPNNAGFNLINEFTTLVNVYNTNKNRYEFMGRVLYPESEMGEDGLITKKVTCESLFAYLCDSQQAYVATRNWTVSALLKHLIDCHNSQVEPEKQFTIGTVTAQDDNDNLYLGIQRENTWDAIASNLIEKIGGELQFRVEDDVLYIDYLDQIGETKETEIALSVNMKSIIREKDPTAFITRLIPLGSKVSDNSEERIGIASVNGGLDYIDDTEAIAKYGIHVGYVEFDDVTSPSILLTKARNWLTENNRVQIKYSISALDLSLLGLAVDDFDVGNYHPIKNALLVIDDTARIIKQTVDICNEVESTIEVGDNFKTLSDIEIEQRKAAAQNIATLKQTTSGLKSEVNTAKQDLNALAEEVELIGEPLTPEEVFNALCQDGTLQGLYTVDGQLYINASYIKTGEFLADLIKAGVIKSVDGTSVVIDLDNGQVSLKGTIRTEEEADEEGGLNVSQVTPKAVSCVLRVPGSSGGYYIYSTGMSGKGVKVVGNDDIVSQLRSNYLEIRPDIVRDDYDDYSATMKVNPDGLISKINLTSKASATPLEIASYNGNNYIHGLSAPTADSHAANKGYVDGLIDSVYKEIDAADSAMTAYVDALEADVLDNTYNFTMFNVSAVASNTGSPISGMPYYAILHPDYSVVPGTPISTHIIMLGNDSTQSGGATPTPSVMLGSMSRSGSIISQILAFSTGYQTVRATIGVWYKRNG